MPSTNQPYMPGTGQNANTGFSWSWMNQGGGGPTSTQGVMGQGFSPLSFSSGMSPHGGQSNHGLEQLLQGMNPGSIGGKAMSAFLQDYQNTQGAIQGNYDKFANLVEDPMAGLVAGIQGQQDQWASEFQQTLDQQSGEVVGNAEAQHAEFLDYRDAQLSQAKQYFDEGIAGFEGSIDEYGQNQAALWASQASSIDAQVESSLSDALNNPNLTTEQRSQLETNTKFQAGMAKQNIIGQQQAQVENIMLQANQQLGQLRSQAGAALGNLGAAFGGQLLQSQQGVQAAKNFVASMQTAGKQQMQAMQLQAKNLELAGLGALGQAVKSNPLLFAQAGPIAMAALNLMQIGANPYKTAQNTGNKNLIKPIGQYSTIGTDFPQVQFGPNFGNSSFGTF